MVVTVGVVMMMMVVVLVASDVVLLLNLRLNLVIWFLVLS
jgi:hypothetical protein